MGGCVSKDEERVSLPHDSPHGCLKNERKQKQKKKTSEEEFQQLVAEGFIPTDTPMPGCKEELKKLIKQGETKKKFEQWKEKHNMVVVDGRLVSASSALQNEDPSSSFSFSSMSLLSRPLVRGSSLSSSSSLHSSFPSRHSPRALSKVDELCDDAESLQGSESTTPQQQHMSRNPLVVGRGSNIVNDDSFVGVRGVLTESFGDETALTNSSFTNSPLTMMRLSERQKCNGSTSSAPSSAMRSASQSQIMTRRVSFSLPTHAVGANPKGSLSGVQLTSPTL